MVQTAISPILQDRASPLLLAGVEYVVSIFREINDYPNTLEDSLDGNYDYDSDNQIHDWAWPLVEPRLPSSRENAVDKFQRWLGTDQASNDIGQILPAAISGRVETVFIDTTKQLWGQYVPTGIVSLSGSQRQFGDDDLIDLAAVQVLQHGGTVYALADVDPSLLTIPHGVAAVMRY
ncbi:MAG: hypothetical protein R3C28_26090 [Pirellulaceae bacterium]